MGRQCILLQLFHTVNWKQRDGELFFMTFQVFICFSAIVQCLIFRVFAVLLVANGSLDIVSSLYHLAKEWIKEFYRAWTELPTWIVLTKIFLPPGTSCLSTTSWTLQNDCYQILYLGLCFERIWGRRCMRCLGHKYAILHLCKIPWNLTM